MRFVWEPRFTMKASLSGTALAALLAFFSLLALASPGSSQCPGGGPPPPPPGPNPSIDGSRPNAPAPAPSIPAAGAPTTPSPAAPGPASPTTPGPRAPAGITLPGVGVRAAAPAITAPYLPIERGPTSQDRLLLDWHYPVYVSESERLWEETGEISTFARGGALSREEAFRFIAGDDPRPLLVLRECTSCNGTDWALLQREESNEKTLLLARWFHCVKLPPHVLHQQHALRKLFPEEDPPHLFLSSRDGSNLVALEGDQSRTELWHGMQRVLREEYRKDPNRALRGIVDLLARYDRLDALEQVKLALIEREVERRGPEAPKLRRLHKDLEGIRQEKDELFRREAALLDLELRREAAPSQD